MNNLKNFNTSELTEQEMLQANGGFGLLFIAFHLGLALAYYEQQIKDN